MLQFQKLVSATIKSFKRRCVPLDELVSHVMTLGTFDPVFKEPQVPLFCHHLKQLNAADTIPKVFLVLNDYFSLTTTSLSTSSKNLEHRKIKLNYTIIRKNLTTMQSEESLKACQNLDQ